MESRAVNFCACNAASPLMIERVPADVCTRCGGQVFSDEVAEVFERIRDGLAPRPRLAQLRVFDFDTVRNYRAGIRQRDELTSIFASTIDGRAGVAFQIYVSGKTLSDQGGTAVVADGITSQLARVS